MDRISEKFGALQETHYWHSTMRKQISGFLHCLCLVLIKFFHFDSLGCFMSGWGRNHRTVELDGTFKIILLAIVHPCLLSFFLFKVKGGSIYLAHSVYGVQSMIHWLQGRNMVETCDRAKVLRSQQLERKAGKQWGWRPDIIPKVTPP